MSGGNISHSLEFQIANQPKPSRQKEYFLELSSSFGNQSQPYRLRKFVLKSSDFRCPGCLCELLRCLDCITLVNIATKEYLFAKRRINKVISAYEKAPSSKKYLGAETAIEKAIGV